MSCARPPIGEMARPVVPEVDVGAIESLRIQNINRMKNTMSPVMMAFFAWMKKEEMTEAIVMNAKMNIKYVKNMRRKLTCLSTPALIIIENTTAMPNWTRRLKA